MHPVPKHYHMAFTAYSKTIPEASELVTWDKEHTTAWLDHWQKVARSETVFYLDGCIF